ncbi:lysosomal dipeptide transporter MFSD1-like [Argopecten irradians]|uniref:lysosomal dipeptide transporter MFSD1-like n=1 Tax=Argopecten irradians TaxID=31199 RepID=UPI0037201A77
MKPYEWKWRYAILFCDCAMAAGLYFCVDMPSPLQIEFQGGKDIQCQVNETSTLGACCDTCLDLGPTRYNLLHAFLYWTSSITSLLSGYVTDRIGNSVSAVLIIILSSLGSLLFAIAGTVGVRGTSSMFPMMIVGRMLLGLSDGPLRIVQDRVIVHWFAEDSYLPISAVLLSRRSGTLLSFWTTENIAAYFGFSSALWIGFFLCMIGIVASLVLAVLDYHGTRTLDQASQQEMACRPVKLSDIVNLPTTFWIHISMLGFHYCTFFTFVANISQYIQLRYGYNKVQASYVTGASYIGPVFLSPFAALLLRKIDCNGLMAMLVIALSIPVYLLMIYCPSIPPLVPTLAIGIIYTFTVIIMWQVIMTLLPPAVFGTGAGMAIFLVRVSVGLTNLAFGAIVENKESPSLEIQIQAYQDALLLIVGFSVMSLLTGILLNVMDIRRGDGVNRRLLKDKVKENTSIVSKDKLGKHYGTESNN